MSTPHTKSPLMRYIQVIAMNITLILCVYGIHYGAVQWFGIDLSAKMKDAYVWSFIFAYTSLLFIYDQLIRHSIILSVLLTALSVILGLSAGLAVKLLIS